MASREEVLLEELLNNARVSGNQVLERRLADLAVWYYQNKTRIPPENLTAKMAFLEKAMWILLEVNALQVERIHELEARSKSKSLWLPKGLVVEGDIRRYG